MRVLLALAAASAALAFGCGGRVGAASTSQAVSGDAGAQPPRPPPLPDAAPDAPPDPAPTPFDAGGTSPPPAEAGACAPGDVADFAPDWRPPPNSFTGDCSAAQLQSAVDACFGEKATPGSCAAWRATGDADGCIECLISPSVSRTWAPIVSTLGELELFNVGGCVALADPTQLACAQAVQAALQCEMNACFGLCRLPDSGEPAAVQGALGGCFQAAGAAGCTAYASAASACVADAGTVSFCYQAPQDDTALVQLLGVACGPADGG